MTLFYTPRFEHTALHLQKEGFTTFLVPEFEDVVREQARDYSYTKTFEEARLDPCVICHTSGSTGTWIEALQDFRYLTCP